MLPEFDLLMPQTVSEALEMLAEAAPDVLPLAGGTNLIVDMRAGRQRPRTLVNVAGLDELQGVRRENGYLVLGGGTTIAQMLDHPLIAEHAPVLRESARVFANPLIRNRATVAGNLVDASPAANLPPPLLVLDAEVELTSRSGTRWVALDDFLVDYRQTLRRPEELLTAVRWPIPAPHSAATFHKLGLRKSDAVAVVSVAVRVTLGDDGMCKQARISLGAVAPRAIRARAAEDALRGQPLTTAAIAEAARLSAEATRCIDDVRSSAAYRERVTEALVRRLLGELTTREVR